jgi:hypothetical protein
MDSGKMQEKIYESGKMPNRTYEAIRRQLKLDFIASAYRKAIIETIKPASDALTLEEVDKLVLERFRIAFQSTKDYGALLVII